MRNISEEVNFYSGKGNYQLAIEVLEKLTELVGQTCRLSHVNFNRFPEGELDNRFASYQKISGKTNVFFQSITTLDLSMETLDLTWAANHQYNSKRNIGVFPFIWNRRQDSQMEIGPDDEPGKKAKPDEIQRLRQYISFLAYSGINDMIVATPHSSAMAKYSKDYGVNFHEIDPSSIFVEKVQTFVPDEELYLVNVYSPDLGSVKRAVKMAKLLKCPVLFNLKNRPIYNETCIANADEEELKKLTEELRKKYDYAEIYYATSEHIAGKIIIMVEDEVASGGTANSTGQLLKSKGAKSILFFATHSVFTWGWKNKFLQENPFTKIIMANSIHRDYEKRTGGLIVDVSLASPIASTLFKLLTS
jgi:phosphoribosylpyrophosphate synthetase